MHLKSLSPINQIDTFENIATNERYFLEMLNEDSLRIAQPFLNEERQIILNLIQNHTRTIFFGLGSGSGLYSDIISRYCKYIGIDPLHQSNKNIKQAKIISSKFQDVIFKETNEKSIISFLFNLISYIDQFDVIDFLNKNSKEGDIITISTWNTDRASQNLRKKYFTHINNKLNHANSSHTENITELKMIRISDINNYKSHEILELRHTKILIIYL